VSNQTEWWAPVESGGESTDLFGGDPASPEGRRARSRGRQRAARERKQRRRRSIVIVVVALAMVIGAGYVVYSLLGGMFDDKGSSTQAVDDYKGPGFGSASVTIAAGDTGADMGAALQDAGVVATSKAFATAFADNPDAAKIQPGTYRLLQEMKASDAVQALLNPASRESFRVTIAEGLTADQILDKISEKTLIPVADLKKAAKDSDAIGLPKQADGKLEGWLFPATYDVEPDSSATDVLKLMTAQTVKVLEKNKVAKDDWEKTLNEASLIEREAKRDEDRPKMARAIDNRFARGMPLQIDAAVAYGLGINGTKLTRADTEDPSNPYNIYIKMGLPPTPIASPGEASIKAVLNPADGDWIYWQTVNPETGETVFSDNLDDHIAAGDKADAWVKEHDKG